MTTRTTNAAVFALLIVSPAGNLLYLWRFQLPLNPLTSRISRTVIPRSFVWVLSAVLSTCVVFFVIVTRHWPFVGDEAIIRYVDFLISRGKVPYRDILDINLPGSYAADWIAVRVFGPSSVAWRFFDLTLLAIATVAAISIAKPFGWFGGFIAGHCFSSSTAETA